MEVTQFTYFQQVGGIECDPVSTELTYGLERLAMYVQGVENVYDLDYNGARARPIPTATSSSAPSANSRPIISSSPTPRCCSGHFADAETGMPRRSLRARGLPLPAYDQCIKASHLFNLLDARGAISVTERAAYIGRVRALAKACCEAWLAGGRNASRGNDALP